MCDEIWVLDLGGEGRGTRRSENVFAIQTPVAITLAVCYKKPNPSKPAKVHYFEIIGNRSEKLAKLDSIHRFQDIQWQACPTEWHAPFRPAGKGNYFDWPLLTDLMPWQTSGLQIKRTWPISFSEEILQKRWKALLKSDDKLTLFKETRDRKINKFYAPLPNMQNYTKKLSELSHTTSMQPCIRYAFRSFDHQWLIADNRLGDFMRPDLWRVHSDKQLYFASMLYAPLGVGPALTISSDLPDLHYFSGRGAKDIIPFFKDRECNFPNIDEQLLLLLKEYVSQEINCELWAAYVYCILACEHFTNFFDEKLISNLIKFAYQSQKIKICF